MYLMDLETFLDHGPLQKNVIFLDPIMAFVRLYSIVELTFGLGKIGKIYTLLTCGQ